MAARIHLVLATASGLLAAALAVAAPSGSKPSTPSALPSMPGSTNDANAATAPTASGATARTRVDPATLVRAAVTIERHDRMLGMGVALAHDGRVLTAYSALGDHNDVDVRYADGAVVHARLQDHDLGWDLALLTPEESQHTDGVPASGRDPTHSAAPLTMFAQAPSRRHLVASTVTLKGRRTFQGAGDAVLENALELGTKISPNQLGSPIIDDTGGVVAIVGRGCLPAENGGSGCTLSAFGAPVDAIRRFLMHAPARAPLVLPWLGVQGTADSIGPAKGVRLQVVRSESPADEAGLRGGEREQADLVLAVDGTPVTTPDALNEAIRTRSIGDRVSLIAFREGKYRMVQTLLQAAPPSSAAPASGASARAASTGAPESAPRSGAPHAEDRKVDLAQ